MNRAELLRLRAVEERRGLVRVWRMLNVIRGNLTDSQYGNLTDSQYGNLHNKYRQHYRQLEDLERQADRDLCGAPDAAVTQTEEFEREVFCYVIGRLLRARPFDQRAQGVGGVADQLLAELAHRACIAVPPITGLELELGWETLSPLIELVRLRFPGAGIWDLPVLAHEFGHYVLGDSLAVDDGDVGRLRGARARLARGLKGKPTLWRRTAIEEDDSQCLLRVEEMIADVFATYALGPAYPQCCIALRVPLTGLDILEDVHPPWRYRIAAMIETLRRMTEPAGDRPALSAVEADMRSLWRALSGDPGFGLINDDLEVLRHWVDEITGMLMDLSDLGYVGGRPVDQIAYLLDGDTAASRLPTGATVVHVLNAAWRWRLDRERTSAEVDRAAQRTLEYCEHIGRSEHND